MTLLRGHFAMMLVCEGSAPDAEIERALAPLTADGSLTVTVREVPTEHVAPGDGTSWVLSVHGGDRPGIVSAVAAVVDAGLAGPANQGPHGFTEILYAYTSGTGNNGSAFAGLSANTLFYNTTIGIAMFIGRFVMIVPMLAIAGSLAAKRIVPASAGTFPTHGPVFVGLVVGVILIVGGLTFFPALALGPIAEQLAMVSGKLF